MKFEKLAEAMYGAGWRDDCDANHSGLRKLHAELFPVVAELEDERESCQSLLQLSEAQNKDIDQLQQALAAKCAELSGLRVALNRLSRYLAGGHYEPRNQEEGKLAALIMDTLGVGLNPQKPTITAMMSGEFK